jgi:quercetin dioxygenase-like cupin family protein
LLELTIDGHARTLKAGEAYIAAGNVTHSARSVGGGCKVLDVFSPIREDYAKGTNQFTR